MLKRKVKGVTHVEMILTLPCVLIILFMLLDCAMYTMNRSKIYNIANMIASKNAVSEGFIKNVKYEEGYQEGLINASPEGLKQPVYAKGFYMIPQMTTEKQNISVTTYGGSAFSTISWHSIKRLIANGKIQEDATKYSNTPYTTINSITTYYTMGDNIDVLRKTYPNANFSEITVGGKPVYCINASDVVHDKINIQGAQAVVVIDWNFIGWINTSTIAYSYII